MVASMVDESQIYQKLFSDERNTNETLNDMDTWDFIVQEYEIKRKEYEEHLKSKSKIPSLPDEIVKNTVWGYMDANVFSILIPALNSMMIKAKKYNAVRYNKKTRFNGLDHLAELLWNFNPNYPERYKNYTDIYDVPFVVEHLKHSPRKIFPKSEIWTQNYAAIKIQSFYRGYLVRKEEQVQEMRKFWKELTSNPRYSVSIFDHTELAHNRDISRRLQCFCDMNPVDCINPEECEIVHHSEDDSQRTPDSDGLFMETKYF